jgi:hypothetical protein
LSEGGGLWVVVGLSAGVRETLADAQRDRVDVLHRGGRFDAVVVAGGPGIRVVQAQYQLKKYQGERERE